MGYSISLKRTKNGKIIHDKLCLIDWRQLDYPEPPGFHFCWSSKPSYGPKNSFGFDYSTLKSEQRVALYNFTIELSNKCGQGGIYYYDTEKSSGKLDPSNTWDKEFFNHDMYLRWVKFFNDILKSI